MKKIKRGTLYTGTSNIVLPLKRELFPNGFQQKSRLHYYSSLFNSLEINSSFYKVPMRSTFEKWSMDTGDNFRFTIKLFKDISHARELKFDIGHIDTFMERSTGIGSKKGCLLVQFPGKISLDYYNQVEIILKTISVNDPENTWKKAVEFRSDSWYVSETYELLDEYRASTVLHDIPKGRNTAIMQNANFVYLRYHGPAGDYRGSYNDAYLLKQSSLIKACLKQGKDVFAYFNNTMGSAYANAITLKSFVEN